MKKYHLLFSMAWGFLLGLIALFVYGPFVGLIAAVFYGALMFGVFKIYTRLDAFDFWRMKRRNPKLWESFNKEPTMQEVIELLSNVDGLEVRIGGCDGKPE